MECKLPELQTNIWSDRWRVFSEPAAFIGHRSGTLLKCPNGVMIYISPFLKPLFLVNIHCIFMGFLQA